MGATAESAMAETLVRGPIGDPDGDGVRRRWVQPGRYHTDTVSSLRIGPRPFLILCRFTLAMVVLNVVTGAAVRLSDSGLGCPDWPTCSQHRLTPPLGLHPVVEFGNRLVVFVLVIACLVTVVASFLRRPARNDLRWLSSVLVVGVIGEAVLGAFVVYTKLNPYVVMTHFMVGMALLAAAVELTLVAGHGPGRGTLAVSRGARATHPVPGRAHRDGPGSAGRPPPGPGPTPVARVPSGYPSGSRT